MLHSQFSSAVRQIGRDSAERFISTTPSAQRHINGQPGWAEHSSDGRSAAPKIPNGKKKGEHTTRFFKKYVIEDKKIKEVKRGEN